MLPTILRTPLTHLRQRLENARAQARDMGEYSAAVARAIGDTDEILAVFSSLLRISQVEAGTRRSSFTELSLSELLDRIYEIYRPVAEDSGHVLSCDIAPGVRIRGDAELLLQLFINVVENALRHTSAGTRIHIALSASQGCRPGNGVRHRQRGTRE
jgi:signal transduction histidine kinase